MNTCPQCGHELLPGDGGCPVCKKPGIKPFTIRTFLWENFRLFTMAGMIGTMISLIPNMGSRVLGEGWITRTDTFLPLFLSVIIFFGAIFLTILFLIVFGMIAENRNRETILRTISTGKRTLLTWYEGDFQRLILYGCLIPMWIGITLFFILLMPQIPNRYSWLFAAVTMLTVVPLIVYATLGWKIGKTTSTKIPVLRRFPKLGLLVILLIVVILILLVPLALPQLSGNDISFSKTIAIHPDQQFYSPSISTAKGLRFEVTNLSGRELLASRFAWSADYGYFINVIPSTSEVTVLGNPVEIDSARYMYWTFPKDATIPHNKPVKIDLRITTIADKIERGHATVCLDGFTNDIVQVNATCPE
ncbi:MAG: hypothetical protein WC586_12855 [Methanoregula sp.]